MNEKEETEDEGGNPNWLLAQWALARWGWAPSVSLGAWATVGLETWEHFVALLFGFIVSGANYRAGFTMGCCCQLVEEEEARMERDDA